MRGEFIELEEGLPQSLSGEKSVSKVEEEDGRLLYDGDISDGEAFLLEEVDSTYDENRAYRVTAVEGIETDMDEVMERVSCAEGYEAEPDDISFLRRSGPSVEIETDTVYQEDSDPRFHVREMVSAYRQRTENLEYTPGKPPEGSWGE